MKKLSCAIRRTMCRFALIFAFAIFHTLTFNEFTASAATSEKAGKVYVDSSGLLRMSSDDSEARYYGVNYTVPFAHAYRALENLGVDRHSAIDRDVYHLSRLGLNAFRLHLWDVELTDSLGNLQDNEHLELLDYLIESLENRGIDIILTAQTNFGNGYPERNEPTGGFSYLYDKCDMHENPEAISAQKRHIDALSRHKNRYTGFRYCDDPSIIAMEINNEPCHDTDSMQVTDYINTMTRTLRNSGWGKPILYNVSHNIPLAQGYFNANIDGTTYQWYPIGLVSGKSRQGNFLPFVDNYRLPYTNLKGYKDKVRVIYEFDPADMPDSYLYPAVARTFAREGFQWATQFAYDPVDMASYNTEYQTHFLNLAYTPGKAIGMKIARKVMDTTPRGAQIPKYPLDTVFGNASVSYRKNLATWTSPEEYFHTNSTDTPVKDAERLHEIAGVGSSPLVDYNGLGAYFIDRISPSAWRVEVMPDALPTVDPYTTPSLEREAVIAISATHPMTLRLPGLNSDFSYQSVTEANPFGGTAAESTFAVRPGVYLVANDSTDIASIDIKAPFGNGTTTINEFVAPPMPDAIPLHVNHLAAPVHREGDDLVITAQAFGPEMPDSLVVYPDDISFWREDNRLYTMHRIAPYLYKGVIPGADLKGRDEFRYRICVYSGDQNRTFPGAVDRAPLDWDYAGGDYYITQILAPSSPVTLLDGARGIEGIDISTIPDYLGRSSVKSLKKSPIAADALLISTKEGDDTINTVLTCYVKDIVKGAYPAGTQAPTTLKVRTGTVKGTNEMTVSLVNADGITFGKTISLNPESVTAIPLSDLQLRPTLLCPAPYPVFLGREFMPEGYTKPLDASDVERLQLVFPCRETETEIIGVWLE